ncbi:MAG: alginate export family protein, partial [Desulfococcaceae bacterium]
LFAENETLASPAEQAVLPNTEELNIWYAGADIDFSFDPVSFWLTGIYQGGDADLIGGGSVDFEGYLGAAGASVGMGFGEIHAEAFYASGDDDNDGDIETFFVPGATESYYWAEIMGYGVFDDQVSNNAPADQIYNIMAANFGLTLNPMDKLEVGMDVWYAQLVEEITLPDGSKEDYLGTEVDLRITYELVDNLNLDVIGAYLFAGDATTMDSPNDADPYEVGAQLSLSF